VKRLSTDDADQQDENRTEDRYAHLRATQWKPGQSGNPAGRPKRESFESIVQRLLDLDHPNKDVDCSRREYIARQFVDMMEGRNDKVLKEFADRVWPKLTKHEITGRDGEPVDFRQIIEKARSNDDG
jgi:hypothetical protein